MNEIIDNILTAICNLTLILLLFYVVFWLNYSGWWFLILFVFGFRSDKNQEQINKQEETNDV
jgi:hypothetical protein